MSLETGRGGEGSEDIPLINWSRFRQIQSFVYPFTTFSGSQVFHMFWANLTFWWAVSGVKGA